MIKFWHSISFWLKLKLILGGLGIGSEITLFMTEAAQGWKWLAGIATIIAFLITHLIEDKDNNGLADIFEKKKK